MCGRYSLTTPPEALRGLLDFDGPTPNLAARYNIAPRQAVPVVRCEGTGERHLVMLRWGLVPYWAKDEGIGDRLINARSETAAEKPSFRRAMETRRCLIPVDGFYEWKAAGKLKQPYRIELDGRRPFAFAGLWERWEKGAGGSLETCAILTTEANDRLRAIHHRMPVILDPAAYGAWLDVEARDPRAVAPLLRRREVDGLVT
ncbi:MAG: SOS response-associated peptidase, partial [Rhodospirillaceae bacterium]|nr:SOS response-associated peptidase [Rhodospirillaceae bacterium]